MKSRYNCDSCPKTFASSSSRTRHIEAIHKNIRYHCPTCNKKIKYKQHISQHNRTCRGVDLSKEICPLCTNPICKMYLSRHIALYCKGNIKCEICGEYITISNKSEHIQMNHFELIVLK
jgi:hypothetical protein